MRTVALPFVVSALLLTGCSATSSSPEELATLYMDSIIKNDKSLMAKVLTPSDLNSQHWNNYAERLQAIQADAKHGAVTSTKKKCWHASDIKATFCDFSLDSKAMHLWSLTIKVADGQSKVDSAASGR